MLDAARAAGWHPVAASGDLPFRHVYQAELWGQELAVWRADDGFVNVWENRCLHRGVRLSIGHNLGSELRCQYHGWRYANRSAGCTYIPAHPADAPARTICNRTFERVERYGLVWTALAPDGAFPAVAALEGGPGLALRAIPVAAPPGVVADALTDYSFAPAVRADGAEARMTCERPGPATVVLEAVAGGAGERLVLFVQPVDAHRSVIRGVLAEAPPDEARLAVLRDHSARLSALRDRIEASVAGAAMPASLRGEPAPPPVPTHAGPGQSTEEAPPTGAGRTAALRVVVAAKRPVASDVASFRLEPLTGTLPAFQPGAHIDVHLPNALVRQYSITNGPDETGAYVIAVKREEPSRGGSACLHDVVGEGDVLAISEPRSNFPLRRDAVRTLLLAGGIGLTPLLSMARTLSLSALAFELHHFARDAAHAPLADAVAALGEAAHVHLGLDAQATGERIEALLTGYAEHDHVYVCGPAPMIAATRASAERLGWPESAVHYEHFANENAIDTGSGFEIVLARSGVTLEVPAGSTIVEVLREHGLDIVTSCEQGACGTCKVAVLEGEPDHQDVYLGASERAGGKVMMACVSRARSARLVLDL